MMLRLLPAALLAFLLVLPSSKGTLAKTPDETSEKAKRENGSLSSSSVPGSQLTKSKKELYLEAKTNGKKLKKVKVPRRAKEVIWAKNLHTHEVAILSGPGSIGSHEIKSYFRCWFTHRSDPLPADLNPLVERIVKTAKDFDTNSVRIVSAYRHPKYNIGLRKKGREVALNSHHTRGEAIDFFLPGVPTKKLYRYLLKNHRGGVGFYPYSSFVHIDTGRKRTWRGH